MPDPHPYTPVVEDYLKTIWKLQQRADASVSTSSIAEQLALSAAAVTAMVKRLAEQRLVTHEPYYGVRLTAAGELAVSTTYPSPLSSSRTACSTSGWSSATRTRGASAGTDMGSGDG